MRVIYSFHAKNRMRERGVVHKSVIDVVEFPEYIISRGEEIEAYKKVNGCMTKVVYVKKDNYLKIITVYQLR